MKESKKDRETDGLKEDTQGRLLTDTRTTQKESQIEKEKERKRLVDEEGEKKGERDV